MNPFRTEAILAEPSTFTPEGLLREARRQKNLHTESVPAICVLDPDGDVARWLRESGRGKKSEQWPCYHTELWVTQVGDTPVGVIGCAVGAPFAVLVAEELFASGCELLISVTSAGQLSDAFGPPPYFVLIAAAWRDEGTSDHYLPPSEKTALEPGLLATVHAGIESGRLAARVGEVWTTDAPFRETASTIEHFRACGAVAVEMEAAALYAFARARGRAVVCFAHVTNQMAARDGDFEKGRDNGAHATLELVQQTIDSWRAGPSPSRAVSVDREATP